MSGTSMDGIDLALIESDGEKIVKQHGFIGSEYSQDFKSRLRSIIYGNQSATKIKEVENELTFLHIDLVHQFLNQHQIKPSEIDVIGFHGHTIAHNPQKLITWQIGNAHLLAEKTGIDVIADFRSRDIILGGQGAPLVPIYHYSLFSKQSKPTATLNIGGISNITYFDLDESSIRAFDVCFGNAPFDDLMKERFAVDFDKNGQLSISGKADKLLAEKILEDEIFHKKPPKSFSRDDFVRSLEPIKNLKSEDALATYAYMHARVIDINLNFLPKKPKEIFICGGGRKNLAIINQMKEVMGDIKIMATEEIGINGDSVEGEAFAFLAIRSLRNLPISFPFTTGVENESCGGVLFKKLGTIS